MADPPPTRWELQMTGSGSRYAEVFEDLIARHEDVDGEARLADVLAPRGARILDAGAGLGRVAGALVVRGHDVTAVEKDPDLVGRSHRLFPDVPVVRADILELTPALLEGHGRPTEYDVIVVVGNVMIYLAEDTEVRALTVLRGLLAPAGRVLVGFDPVRGPRTSRDYPVERFRADAEAAGLVVVHEFGTYDLAPAGGDYVVAVLRRAE
jgi:SAM-dependent methyltransferase